MSEPLINCSISSEIGFMRDLVNQEKQRPTQSLHQEKIADKVANKVADKAVERAVEKVAEKVAQQNQEKVISWSNTRYFAQWLIDNRVSLLISTYKQHKLLCLGLQEDGNLSLFFTDLLRPMGIYYDEKTQTIYSSNLGNIIQYENVGENMTIIGKFDALFVPKRIDLCPDIDIHDIRYSEKYDKIFFVSPVYNSVLTVSKHKSFDVFWTPNFISKTHNGKLSREDRCHLNGIALVNGLPKYVTAACTRDYYYAWKEHHGEGVVIDIETNEIVCGNLYAPHSPGWYKDRLYIGEAGTGYFGYVDLQKKEFVPKKFLPGFIRGITFVNNYALVTLSKDRHCVCFADIPLGKTLQENGQSSMCGFCVINLESFDIIEYLEFSGVDEVYDIVALPNIMRPRIADFSEKFEVFF